jgi:Ca-activated chloride channel family protein
VKPVVLVPALLLLAAPSASAQSAATPPAQRNGSPLTAAGATAPAPASAGQSGGARRPGGAGADATSEALVQTVADISGKASPGARDYRRLTEATLDFARRKAMGGEGFSPGVITSALDAVDAGEALDRSAADWPTLRKELEAYLDGSQEPPPPQPEQQKDQQKDQNPQSSDPSQQNEQQEQQQNENSEPKPGESPPQNSSSANDAKSPTSPPSDPSSETGEPPQNPENRESAFGNMQRPPSPPPTPPPAQSAGDADRQPVGGQPPRPSNAEGKPELAMPLQKLDQVKQADSPAKLFRVMEGKPTGPATGKKGQTW